MAKPAIQVRLESQLRAKGQDPGMARRLLQKSGNLDASGNATPKGAARGAMTPEQRAKDRQAKYSGRKPEDFNYDIRTNRATLKKKK